MSISVPLPTAGRSPSGEATRWPALAPLWVIAMIGLAVLIWSDLGPPLAFIDDWTLAWDVRQLVAHHAFHVVPEQSALALVQIVWGAVFSLGHSDQRLLRLSVVPFVLLAAVCVCRLSAALGATRFWAVVGGLALVTSPIYLGIASTFMTDVVYTGLLMAAGVVIVRWVREGTGLRASLVWGVLATLQRQSGIGIAATVSLGLLLARRKRAVARREWVALAGLWSADVVAEFLPALVGVQTGTHRLLDVVQANPLMLLRAVAMFIPVLGVVASPFLLGLVFGERAKQSASRWVNLPTVLLGELGLVVALMFAVRGLNIFPGIDQSSYFSAFGLNPAFVAGVKPALYPMPLFMAVEAIAVATVVTLLLVHRQAWTWARLPLSYVVLITLAASQLLPMLQGNVYTRYYLPVVAPLIPLIAVLASRTTRPAAARAWAPIMVAASLALFVVGEQDYTAWQLARDQAARLAYQTWLPDMVNAGYEANAVYWELPTYERTGIPLATHSDVTGEPSIIGPPSARVQLEFASPTDPRPGVSYRSLAPGRIVIAPVP